MKSTKQPITPAENAANILNRIREAYQRIDPAQLDPLADLLQAAIDYKDTGAETFMYDFIGSYAPAPSSPTTTGYPAAPAESSADLAAIAGAIRAQMPPEAAAQLVLDISEALEADAAGIWSSFKAMPPYDQLCLTCRESYVKGFVDACNVAAAANALPPCLKL